MTKKPKRLKQGIFTIEALLQTFSEMEEEVEKDDHEKEIDVPVVMSFFMARRALELCVERDKKKGDPRVVC